MVLGTVDAQVWSDISGLISEQIWLIDHRQIMQAYDLFADVPRLELVPPAPQAAVHDGRDAVHGWFSEFADRVKNLPLVTSRHVISNLRMMLREDGSVAASHVLTVYRDGLEGRRATDPVVVTDADEVFVRERGVWKIASRVLTPVFGPG
jgi:hypothetical protein